MHGGCNMKKMILLIAKLLSVDFAVYGSEKNARIDISGAQSKITLTPGTASDGATVENYPWIKNEDEKKLHIMFTSPKVNDEWQVVEFSFTPDKDGDVLISILGQWYNEKQGEEPYHVLFKEVEILNGSTLTNGDFSQKYADGYPIGWSFNKKYEPPVVLDENGTTVIKLQFRNPLSQKITVKADEEVKLRAKVKLAQP